MHRLMVLVGRFSVDGTYDYACTGLIMYGENLTFLLIMMLQCLWECGIHDGLQLQTTAESGRGMHR